MRKSDIKVGDVLYHDPARDWATPIWADGPTDPVMVTEVPARGGMVRVSFTTRYLSGAPTLEHKTVYTTALRGPYDECAAQVRAAISAREAAKVAAKEAKTASAVAFFALRDRLEALGMRPYSNPSAGHVTLSYEVLDALLTAAEATR